MPLSDAAVRNAKPRVRRYKLFDETGLFLIITPEGGKWWRCRYRWQGKEQTLSLGTYPKVTLRQARLAREAIQKQLREGVNPSEARKASDTALQDTFEVLARDWHTARAPRWSTGHAARLLRDLEKDVFPWLGLKPIRTLTALDLKAILQRIQERGALDSAHRVLQVCGQVFRYAIAGHQAERNPAADLKGWLPSPARTHFATITEPQAIGALIRALDGYPGSFPVHCALRLAPRLMVRPGELRRAEWQEIDWAAAEWRIPALKMKMREAHIVPLSQQALAILKELQPLTGRGRYLFPSIRHHDRPMSENTINAALRRLGYAQNEICGHGFRAMASTRLNEQGWSPDVIERQLAHAERNKIRAAYNRAQYLPERRQMMQAWSDDLDALAEGMVR
jgi:integrase